MFNKLINNRYVNVVTYVVGCSSILFLLSGCTYIAGDFVRSETLPSSKNPLRYEAQVRILDRPSIQNPILTLEFLKVPIYEEFKIDKYKEMRVDIIPKSSNGLSMSLCGVGGATMVAGAVVAAGGGNPDAKKENGWLGLGLGYVLLRFGISLYDDSADTLKIPTGKLIDGERSSSFREGHGLPITGNALEVKCGTRIKILRTDQSGRLSINLVEDFRLASFDKKEDITLHFKGENPSFEKQIQVSNTQWTIQHFRVGNKPVEIRSSYDPDSKVIGKLMPGEEVNVLDKGHITHIIKFSSNQGVVDASKGTIRWSIPDHFDENKPPNILIQKVEFNELSEDNYLDAEESGNIKVNIINKGEGAGHKIIINALPLTQTYNGITIPEQVIVGTLLSNQSKSIDIPVNASIGIKSQKVNYKIEAKEFNGFDADPIELSFETRAFRPPNMIVADVGIDDASGNGKIELGESIDITARIQNQGEGEAKKVVANVNVAGEGQNIFYNASSYQYVIGSLMPGTYYDVKFTILTNKRFEGAKLPISIAIEEKHKQFNKIIELDLPLNRAVKRTEQFVIMPKQDKSVILPNVGDLSIDIEKDIPQKNIFDTNAVAVVIGISNYKNLDIPTVDYANRDATTMKEYLVKTFGYDERHIIYADDENASLSDFRRIFEEQLSNYIKPGKSNVFIYYSGHGVPDPETKEAFFVPYDGDPTYAKSTCYSVKRFYNQLNNMKAKSITIVLDACFSGSTPRGMLFKQVSPVYIPVENPLISIEDGVVFASSSEKQMSNWYPEKKHGLFTYYFLKAIHGSADANSDKQITIDEIEKYLLENIPDQARYLNNREQTPQVFAKDKSQVLIKY